MRVGYVSVCVCLSVGGWVYIENNITGQGAGRIRRKITKRFIIIR